jgi:uncharacterized protein (DUF362 family)
MKKTLLEKSVVAVLKVKNSIFESISRAMDLADWTTYLKENQDIALKINLGWDMFIPGSITSPMVTEGVIRVIYDYVDTIYIVESDQVLEDIEKAFFRSNTSKICKKYSKVNWFNTSSKKTITIKEEGNYILKTIDVPKILLDLDFITIPVMKTHDKSTITCALKNQWGCLPMFRHEYHLVLDQALADINFILPPVFVVVDGTIALEGNGPKNGQPKEMNLVLAGNDPVAVDSVTAELMGFDSSQIKHLQFCSQRGIGTNDMKEIKIIGENIAHCKANFKKANHNLVSKLELFFRKSILKKVLFDTFIFKLALFLGKLYYRVWLYFKGRKIWKKLLDHPLYGQQWQNNPYTDRFKI